MPRRPGFPDIEHIRALPALTSQVISGEWEDQNGHINVTFYLALYNDSGWPMFDLIGIDETYFDVRKKGIVDLANHISYLSELHVGDRVTTYGRFLGHDDKRIHGMVFTVNDDKNVLASAIEFLSISMDLRQRRPATMPADVAARVRSVVEAHRDLGWTVPTCLSIRAPG